ncbi:hypothetical protein [Brevundimonas sp. A19_0]|uniref:hypothetical protein n=1 Tax=Brevundimonas sp. A19_0 TaxID=2821087 RepID=UPI001ADC2A42|nr:hypothetical protein [Brevundimonas sp. A19_0]MBO9501074.1 hypothetical protein [Brevundimonas sp. A19_0]
MPRDPAIFPTARVCHGLGATAALLLGVLAGPAMVQAQDAPARDAPTLRYLDWNGRPAPVAMARAETPAARDDIPALRPASAVIPHAGTQSYASVPELRPATPRLPLRTIRADGRPGLTPADAFFAAPQSVPVSAPPPPPPPQPVRTPVAEARPVVPSAPPVRQAPAPAPVERPAPQPEPVPVPAPAPAPTRPPEWADDPMAPRADAPIWSVGQSRQAPTPAAAPAPAPALSQPVAPVAQPQPTYQTDSTPQAAPQGARYYSVHRQNGRQPDRTPMPEQVYLDALPIELEETPSSPSLARPPEPPQLVRNPDGTVRRTTGESARSAGARQ